MNEVYLKASGNTHPAALRTAIVNYIRQGEIVHIDAIGNQANYTTAKAIIVAVGQLSSFGIDINYTMRFIDVEIVGPDGIIKTAIRWTVKRNDG